MIRRPTAVYLDRGLRIWIINQAKKNYWRVAGYYDMADLIQDGMLCYAICRNRYAQTCDGPQHFMALVKTTYRNFITDLANERSAAVEEVQVSQFAKEGTNEQELLERLAKDTVTADGDAELVASLSGASEEIRALMKAINTDSGPGKLLNQKRLTTNERLNALIGTVGHDFETQLRNLLGLPVGQSRASFGFTYDGNLEEVKRAAQVRITQKLAPYDRRKVYDVVSHTFRYIPASAY